jgi:hypothetical protein
MSRRLRDDEDEDDVDEDDDEDFPDDDEVEYLLEALDDDSVRTSVPKSLQSSQRSSVAPSTLTVVSDDLAAPHISHWGIPSCSRALCIKDAPGSTEWVIGLFRPGPTTRPRTVAVR